MRSEVLISVNVKTGVFCNGTTTWHLIPEDYSLNYCIRNILSRLKKNSVAITPQVNYTDRATTACRRS
jgi:hypothetical protein